MTDTLGKALRKGHANAREVVEGEGSNKLLAAAAAGWRVGQPIQTARRELTGGRVAAAAAPAPRVLAYWVLHPNAKATREKCGQSVER